MAPGSTDQQQCYAVHGQRMRSLLTTTGARLQGGVMLQCCSVDTLCSGYTDCSAAGWCGWKADGCFPPAEWRQYGGDQAV